MQIILKYLASLVFPKSGSSRHHPLLAKSLNSSETSRKISAVRRREMRGKDCQPEAWKYALDESLLCHPKEQNVEQQCCKKDNTDE